MSKQTTRILLALTVIMAVLAIAQGSHAPTVRQIPIQLEIYMSIDGRPPDVEVYGLRIVTPGTHTLLLEQVWTITLSKEDAGKIFGDPPLFRVIAYDRSRKDLLIEVYNKDLANWGRPIED